MTHPSTNPSEGTTHRRVFSPTQYFMAGHGRASSIGAALLSLLVLLNSCGSPPAVDGQAPDQPPSTTPAETEAIPLQPLPLEAAPLQTASQPLRDQALILSPPAGKTVVNIYRLDDQCEDFISEPALVAADQPMTDAIGEILRQQDIIAFDLSGYRVSVDPSTQTATIDFRLAPDSQRLLVSLSSCEQLALFGSLRQTLLNNPAWTLQAVQFTNRGESLLP